MAPKTYHHPFEPYDIQTQLMQAVYDCIEDGKVGIFESPTGTGKSLSLICASLTWLRDQKRKEFDATLQKIEIDDDEPEWMVQHARKTCLEDALRLRSEFEARLARVREQEAKDRRQASHPVHAKKKARTDQSIPESEETFMLDDYDSDADHEGVTPRNGTSFSAETRQMLTQMGMLQQDVDDRSETDNEETVKVYICSRTHSQLAQFVGELHRVTLPSSLPSTGTDIREGIRELPLGSRKNLCINPDVQRLQNQTAINERCLELQSSSKSTERCSFVPKSDKPDQLLDFRDHALAKIRDIEELAELGRELKICPYYASRAALGPAEVVLMPYPLLLQRAARQAMNISLKGCVVIIDEAHNLMDAVESTHSSQISEKQLRMARQGLMTYLQKFRARLKGSNRTYIAQVVRVIDSLLVAVQSFSGPAGLTTPGTLLTAKNVDQINLGKLARYISESKLARKVEGYAKFLQSSSDAPGVAGVSSALLTTPVLTAVQNFLITIANPSAEGRFFWDRTSNGIILRYMLLDPSQHFRDIVEEARAVILAGGTMSPMQDHITHVFPYLTDVRTLSCGHIVPATSIFVRTIASDAEAAFEFTYKTRSDVRMVKRTGAQLVRIASIVDGGMVVFFASYAYLEFVQREWEQDGTLRDLRSKKAVFFDSRVQPAEETFRRYTEAIHSNAISGAIIFSVIGGKLSEGINFSDDLGRCVVVIGMPYPNLETPEWKAKLEHIKSRGQARANDDLSQEFAENTCMRAVNQAVGRAIRHKNDWASILLLDARYVRPRIQGKLPAWIRASLPHSQVGTSNMTWEDDLRTFFQRRRT